MHGITQSIQYNIDDNWGQQELMRFLDAFIAIAEQAERIASAFYETGWKNVEKKYSDNIDSVFRFEHSEDLLGLFSAFFSIKPELIEWILCIDALG